MDTAVGIHARNPLLTDNAIVNNHRVAYGVHGERGGEPVVFVHGTPSSSLVWRNVVPEIIREGYTVHVFDLLGYGLSERPWDENADTSITGNVAVLEELLRVWGIDTFHLVAHDIGGAVAQRYAVNNKTRLLSLTLIDSVSFDSYPSERTRQQMSAGLESLAKRPDAEHRAQFREWLLSTHSAPENFDENALAAYLDYISGPIGQASFINHQVAHYDPKHTLEISDRLATLASLPVQLLWGADDSWQLPRWAHKLNDAIPGSALHFIEDCGHFAPEEKPHEVADLLLSFFAGIDTRP